MVKKEPPPTPSLKQSHTSESRCEIPTAPELEQSKTTVLNSLASMHSRRAYEHAIDEFIAWYCSEPRLGFNRSVVLRYRSFLECRSLSSATINLHLSAIRRLADEGGAGIALAGISLGLSAISGPILCLAMLVLGVFFFGVSSSNVWAITQTLAGPQAAGRWTGFQNFIGNLAGVAAPAITGFVLDRTGHFYWAFAILTAVALTGTASWVFLVGPVEQQVWHKRLSATAVSA